MKDLKPAIEAELYALREAILVAEYWRLRGFAKPSETYKPHPLGQLQFHKSHHIIRCLFPGNGFGKTRCIAEEVHAGGTHSNRWQKTPDAPVQMIWLARSTDQFDLMRDQLEVETFGSDATYKSGKNLYEWADGSKLHLKVANKAGEWRKIEGINPDLVAFDEMPRRDVWREMMMRRRVRKKTRFVVAATATQSGMWAQTELYAPWIKHHEALGLVEWDEGSHPTPRLDGTYLYPMMPGEDAHTVNSHPTTWIWTHGGIYSNPAADQGDVDWYEARNWTSQKERMVRLWGGFADWLGDSVFDEDGLRYLLERVKELKSNTTGTRSGRMVGYRRA